MITEHSSSTYARSSQTSGAIKSRWGFMGSLLILLMVPLTVLYQLVFDSGVDTFVHVVLATGALFMALAVRDFKGLPTWVEWTGIVSASVLALIFFLQGLSHVIPNGALGYFGYDLLGPQVEPLATFVYLFVWGGALLFRSSQGVTRILGLIALASVLVMELYRFSLVYAGAPEPAGLRAIYLLPFVWLLFESTKKS